MKFYDSATKALAYFLVPMTLAVGSLCYAAFKPISAPVKTAIEATADVVTLPMFRRPYVVTIPTVELSSPRATPEEVIELPKVWVCKDWTESGAGGQVKNCEWR